MNSEFFWYWLMTAASLFNTVILFWLGLTVLLNAQHRNGGVWLAGLGLLGGGVFFAAHTVLLDYSLDSLFHNLRFLWYPGWAAIIALPAGWYILMLWYAGYWDDRNSKLRRRHYKGIAVTALLGVAVTTFVLLVNPLHAVAHVANEVANSFPLGALSWLMAAYPIFLLLCIILSLDALRHPNPSGRLMGDLARRRARPWLLASTGVQLLVSLLISSAMLWLVAHPLRSQLRTAPGDTLLLVDGLELASTLLIGLAVVLAGKAIVSYEIFTGTTLPRHGILRQWRAVVLLAATYGALVSLGIGLEIKPIYLLLLTTVLISGFSALYSWGAYAERERGMAALRPFVASQHFYENLLAENGDASRDTTAAFRALSEGVLNAQSACLTAVGALAPLVGAPLIYTAASREVASPPAIGELAAQFSSPHVLCVPVEPSRFSGATWAVPLWSERGLIGVLLLGEKSDGGLYTQEEIEIARAGCERLIDLLAGAAMSQRLMSLQRRRIVESQLLDNRTRRVLHDDILPILHAAMLAISAENVSNETLEPLADAHRRISDLLRELPALAAPEIAHSGFVGALKKVVDNEFRGAFDNVHWNIDEVAQHQSEALSPLLGEVIFYAAREAIRNAARHGRGDKEDATLDLTVTLAVEDELRLVIEDNGVGVGTSEQSGGSGQGLALHSTMMAVIGGSLAVESSAERGTRVVLAVPYVGRV